MVVFVLGLLIKPNLVLANTPTPVPAPMYVWASKDFPNNRGYVSPVTNMICNAYYIDGYGYYQVVKFLGPGAEVLIVDGGCEISSIISAADRMVWVAANYSGSYTSSEITPATLTPSLTQTNTATSTSTATSTPTWTASVTSTSTPTLTWTSSPTDTSTATNTATRTPSFTRTRTATLPVTVVPRIFVSWTTGFGVASSYKVSKGDKCWGVKVAGFNNRVIEFTKDYGHIVIESGGCQPKGYQNPTDIKNYLYTKGLRYSSMVLPIPPTLTPTITPTVIKSLKIDWSSGPIYKRVRPLTGSVCWGDVDKYRNVIAVFKISYNGDIVVRGSCQFIGKNTPDQIREYLRVREGRTLTKLSLP